MSICFKPTEDFYQKPHQQLSFVLLCQTGFGSILQRLELPSTVVLKRHETADLVVPISNQKAQAVPHSETREKKRAVTM